MRLIELLSQKGSKIDVNSLNEAIKEAEKKWETKQGLNYIKTLNSIKESQLSSFSIQNGKVHINKDLTDDQVKALKKLMPWKKGPYSFNNLVIDSEWRGDLKWQRVEQSLEDLKDKVVLDIGCANGYFLFQMVKKGAKAVLGIDPVLHPAAQFKIINEFIKDERIFFELLGVEHLKLFENVFDVIFSMGILYHHKDPLEQLKQTKKALRQGGSLYLETIGIEGEGPIAYCPSDRYAKMRNVWLLPTLEGLLTWLEKTKFKEIEIVSKHWDETEEQRVTPWSGEQSYENFLDPNDPSKTIEGHPAPKRFLLKAKA